MERVKEEVTSQIHIYHAPFQMKKICKRRFRITRESLNLQRIKNIKACNCELNPETIINDETLRLLIKGMESAKTARRLNLGGNFRHNLTDLGLYHLGYSLKSLISIQCLTLSCSVWNKISDEGLYYFCKGLKKLRFLKKIEIDFYKYIGVTHSGNCFFMDAYYF